MKKHLLFVLIALLGILTTANAANLIKNPGLEDQSESGNCKYWTTWGGNVSDTSKPHSGSYSAHCKGSVRGSNTYLLYQTINNVKKNTDYKFGGSMFRNGMVSSVYIDITTTNHARLSNQLFCSTANEWNEVSGVWNSGNTEGSIFVRCIIEGGNDGDIWFDDIFFEEQVNTVYFDNTNTNWSNVYVYFYSGKYWEGNGSGSQSSKNCKVGPVQMTQGDNNIYSYEFSGSYNIVAFTKDSQSNYGNFWQTEAAYSDGENFNVEGQYSSSTPLFIAGTDKETKNQNVPYYSGEWSTYPPTPSQHTVKVGGYSGSVSDFYLTSSDNEIFTGSVNLSSEYQFKLTLDGDADHKYSDDSHYTGTATKTLKTGKGRNYIDVSQSGEYQFQFIFSSKQLTITYPDSPTPTQHVVKVYNSETKAYDYTLTSSDNDTFTGSVNLSANYQFKINVDGTEYSDGQHFTETATRTMEKSKSRSYIDICTSGEYQFQYVVSTQKLTVTYPSGPTPPTQDITVTLEAPSGWGNAYYIISSSTGDCGMKDGRMRPDQGVKNYGTMTPLGNNKFSVTLSPDKFNGGCITFSNADMHNWNDFYGNEAVFCDDFDYSVSTICVAGSTYTENNNTKYYTHTWKNDSYTVSVSAGDGGSVEPSGDVQVSGSGVAISATPAAGYGFLNWSVTGGAAVADASSASTTLTATAAGTATANFEAQTSYTIEAKATTGGSIEGTAKYTDQPEGATQSFTASEPQTGYQFDGWTATNEAVISAPEELTTSITIGAFSTVATANYSEILSTISVSAGEGGSVDQSSVNVGVATSAQITATPNAGYKFKEWTLTNATLASGSLTDATISIKADGSGEAGTAVASFEFNPSTGWYLRGSFSDKGWSSDGQIEFLATQGQASGIIGTATLQYDKTDDFKVKVFTLENGTTEKWCGRDNTTISETTSDIHVHYGSGDNINIKPSVIGDYKFILKKSGDNYYMDVTYPEIIEAKSIITVSVASECASMGTVSPSGDIEVGDKLATQISAMPIGSYKLSTWILGGSAVLASGSLTDATISIKADGSGEAGTAVATFEEDPDAKVVKYLNINNWDVVYIHMWEGSKTGTTWHGLPMEKTGEQKYGYDVYSISIKEGDYKKCIFNNNNNQQSADLVFGKDDAQFEPDYTKLVYGFGKWYATLDEIPEPEYITLVYVNKAGWSNVNIQMKGGSQSMDWPGVAMTKSDDKKFGVDVYTYTFMKGQYTNYIINKGDGGGQIEKNIEEGKYVHYNGVRYATLDAIPLPSLAGDFNEWSADANIFELNEEGVGSTTITLEANAKPEFMVIDGQMLGNTGTMTHDNCTNWTMSYQDGGGNNCKIQARNKGEFTFTYDVKTSKLSVTYPEMVTGYSMIINGADEVVLTKQSDKEEYYVIDQMLQNGDVLTFKNLYTEDFVTIKSIDGYSIQNVAGLSDGSVAFVQEGEYDLYFTPEYDNDKLYIGGEAYLDEKSDNAFLANDGVFGQTIDLKVDRPLSSAYYNTICLPFSLSATQIASSPLAGAVIAKYNNATIKGSGADMEATLNFVYVDNIEAGVPYIIQPAADITGVETYYGVTVSETEGSSISDGIINNIGFFKPKELQKDDFNSLFLGAGNVLYWPNVTGSMKGMRAYFNVLLAQMVKVKAPSKMQIMAPVPTDGNEPDANVAKETYKTFNEENIVVIVHPDGTMNTIDGKEVK